MPVYLIYALVAAGAGGLIYFFTKDEKKTGSAPTDPRVLAQAVVNSILIKGPTAYNRQLVAQYQLAVNLPATGLYDEQTRSSLFAFGISNPPPAVLQSPADERAYIPGITPPGDQNTTAEDIRDVLEVVHAGFPVVGDIVNVVQDIMSDDEEAAAVQQNVAQNYGSYNWTPEVLRQTAQTNPGMLDYLLSSGQITYTQYDAARRA